MNYFCMLTIALAATTVQGFSIHSPAMRTNTALSSHNGDITRRNAFQSILAAPALATIAIAQPAFADVTNKVASQSALRYVKRSIKEFEKLEFFAAQNDYAEVKAGIRSPALSEIRKNMQVLIKGGDDGAEAENLKSSYDAFIKGIEDLDSQASLGFR